MDLHGVSMENDISWMYPKAEIQQKMSSSKEQMVERAEKMQHLVADNLDWHGLFMAIKTTYGLSI